MPFEAAFVRILTGTVRDLGIIVTEQTGTHERGKPIGDRKVLENLDFRSRTTGEDAAARSRLVGGSGSPCQSWRW